MDFRRRNSTDHPPLTIDSSTVERVSSTKFLGVHITEDLTWTTNTMSLSKKAQQRLHFLRQLKRASLPPPILTTFYRGTIESVLTSCITVWYGNCSAADRKTLAQQLFPPGCESPELRSPHPPLKPHAKPLPPEHGPPPPPPPTLPHQRKKTVNFILCNSSVLHTGEWGPYKPPVVTHSPLCTRHFSYTAMCTQSHKRLRNICMFTCSCTTTNHLVLFPSQLLDSQCFSLHIYSIYVKHSHSLYSLYFLSLSLVV